MPANIKVTVKLDRGAVNRMLSPQGMVGQRFRRAADKTVQRAQWAAPVKSGNYRRSIRVESVTAGPNGPVCVVTSDVAYATSIEFRQRPVLRQALDQLRPQDFT